MASQIIPERSAPSVRPLQTTLRISGFLDIKFGTVDTVFGTALNELHWAPCEELPAAHRLLTTH